MRESATMVCDGCSTSTTKWGSASVVGSTDGKNRDGHFDFCLDCMRTLKRQILDHVTISDPPANTHA